MNNEIHLQPIIVRYSGEVSLKTGKDRAQSIDRIIRQVEAHFADKDIQFSIDPAFNFMTLSVSDVRIACTALNKVFGISSYSVIEHICTNDLEEIKSLMIHYKEKVEGVDFRVKAKRSGSQKYSSMDIERQAGGVLNQWGNVNLSHPEVCVYIRVVNKKTYIFSEKIKASGGLPPSNRERALVLMSGGFDSAVAAWQMLKRGIACDFLFCNMGGKSTERQCLQVTKILVDLWAPSTKARFFSLDFNPTIDEIKKISDSGYRQIILKREMYRSAEAVLKRTNAIAIVTGESIGQVSSQSLQNLRTIDASVNTLIMRPLLGADKLEIINTAYKIGTGILSAKVLELCGITKGKAVRKSTLKKVFQLEQEISREPSLEALEQLKEINLAQLSGKELQSEYLFVEGIDKEFEVIDCRPNYEFKSWHFPKAINIDLPDLLKTYKKLDKKKKYILYCAFGSQTPVLAEIMQQSGFQAYAFKGGIGKLRSLSQK